MYKKIVTTNSCPFRWNINSVLVLQLNQMQLCLTFNYHFIFQDTLANHITTAIMVQDLLSIPSH